MAFDLEKLAWKIPLKPGPKVLLVALAYRANMKTGECWPPRELLSEMTGFDESTVSVHLRELIDRGLVTQQRRRQQNALYTVVREALVEAAQDVGIPEVLTEAQPTPEAAQEAGLDVGNQDVLNQDVLIQDKWIYPPKTSGIPTSLKRTINNNHSRRSSGEAKPEAAKLCNRLAELMTANGCTPPTITDKWLSSARLLLAKDGRPFPEALAVLEWSQADDFWSTNIHSLPKFRSQFDKLRMRAEKDGALTRRTIPTTPGALNAWLQEQWKSGEVQQIEASTDLRYEQPDLPIGVDGKAAISEFFRNHRRNWITDQRESIIAKLTQGTAA